MRITSTSIASRSVSCPLALSDGGGCRAARVSMPQPRSTPESATHRLHRGVLCPLLGARLATREEGAEEALILDIDVEVTVVVDLVRAGLLRVRRRLCLRVALRHDGHGAVARDEVGVAVRCQREARDPWARMRTQCSSSTPPTPQCP